MKKIFIFTLLFIFLSSCNSNTSNYEYKESTIIQNEGNLNIVKDEIDKPISLDEFNEKITVDKKQFDINSENKVNRKVIINTLNNSEKIEKITEDKNDYIKLANGFNSENIKQSSEKKLKNLININYSDISIKEQIIFDKNFLEYINKDLYKTFDNNKIIYISLDDILNSKTRDIKEVETYFDETLTKKERTVLKRYYIVKNKLKIYNIDFEKLNNLKKDNYLKGIYFINGKIYPVSLNGFSGYIAIKYFELLLDDKKYGILQYFHNEKTLIGLNGMNSENPFYSHQKILEGYTKKILKY